VLADEGNPASAIGGFSDLPAQFAILDRLRESFRTGIGQSYDAGGSAVARGIERMLGPWNRTSLVSDALPKVDGVVAQLEAGAMVADVGCGSGVADVAIAQAFPKSTVHGYDNSKFALKRANANRRAAGAKNVRFFNPDIEPLPAEPTYDLVLCLDCLHDMPRPDLAARAIRRAIKPDGAWFIVDVDCSADPEENMKNPMGAMIYGFSIWTCMSSSASTPDGLALGTAGLPEPEMAKLVRKAGFRDFRRVEGLEHPFNAYYVARP
jgi:SAM-dependent methyltransferase